MPRVKTFGLVLLLVFAFLLIGAYLTTAFRQDSLAAFPTKLTYKQREQLREDLHLKAAVCLDNPLLRALVLKTTLRSFKPLDAEKSFPRMNVYRYEAVLQQYTFFAIPVGETRVKGDTITC